MPDASAPSVTFVRTIPAPPAQVYAAWTHPALMHRWFAPEPYRVRLAEADARVGGRYRIDVAGPAGDVHSTVGEYRELVPGERIVKTWVYRGPHSELAEWETLVTVELRASGAGATELTLTHERIRNAAERESYVTGWIGCLDRLEALHAAGAAG